MHLRPKVLLITPPFTQLNTPYPATVFLKGFLNSIDISSFQADLGIETLLELFSKKNLAKIFQNIELTNLELSPNVRRIIKLKEDYLRTIDDVIKFLQHKKPSLANLICHGHYFPAAFRLSEQEDLDWAFGTMGMQDKARHLATLYLEDLGDLILECVDPHFGFNRYAEHLGRYAYEFDELDKELSKSPGFIDLLLIDLLEAKLKTYQPDILAISVPFPGNLFGAFRCAQFIKANYPKVKVAMGGGFANTELRSLSDARVFNYFDFICLDDGELPLRCLVEYLEGRREINNLKRTFVLIDNQVVYQNNATEKDYTQNSVGIPDYSDLVMDRYLSVIEIANPMHSLWSNGRWNKLMLAHGCYWSGCSFCDTTLDYINRFEPLRAVKLVDKIEAIIEQTGEDGFHFVDEAAPPALLRELALEIIRRKLSLSWWTNIRFEKNFTGDLCKLLAESGCIAVSGGIEVASDRLLKLINKGVDIAQVARVTSGFTKAGIMVHAYLMYGYPTQKDQETIDSLEVVRQMFESGIVKSGFWHRFALTVHSSIAQNPDFYKIRIKNTEKGHFANNDLEYEELKGTNHGRFADGLRISLFNFMQGTGFELPLQQWFDFKIPAPTIKHDLINKFVEYDEFQNITPDKRVVWLGRKPEISSSTKTKKGKTYGMIRLEFLNKYGSFNIKLDKPEAEWLSDFLEAVSIPGKTSLTVGDMEISYSQKISSNFLLFLHGKNMSILRENGLLIL